MTTTTDQLDAVALLAQLGIVAPEPRGGGDEALEFTDAVVSERITVEVLRGAWLWTAGMGWLRWSGCVWEQVEAPVVVEVVRAWVLTLVAGVAAGGDPHRIHNAAGLLSGARIKRVVELAQGQVLADAGAFDADADVLVCGNGVVDLPTGALMPHDPARLVTKRTTVRYLVDATSTDWDAALEAVPEDVLGWLRLRFGQACSGRMPDDDRLCLLRGGGENGKSTVLAAVQAALGTYAGKVPDKVLLGDPSDHSTELMSLRGRRLAAIEETPEARRLSVARLKKVLGTDTIVAREVYKNNVEFKVTHTLFVSSNYLPVVEETDHGTWRRLALVTFPYKWCGPGQALLGPNYRRADAGLRDRMFEPAQQEAVLAWLVGGAMEWYAAGRTMPALPARVEADTQAWRAESDFVLAYCAERLVPDLKAHVPCLDLTSDLGQWLEAKGQARWSDRTVGARFATHEWAAENRVEKKRVRPEGASRAQFRAASRLGERYHGWVGMRFRTREDDARDGWDGKAKLSLHARAEKSSVDPSHPSQESLTEAVEVAA